MSAAQHNAGLPSFRLGVTPERDVVRIAPEGEVDLATIGRIEERVVELVASGFRRVALDLRAVTFLDSSGLRLVLGLTAAARREGWELAVVRGPADVERVFEIAGVRAFVPFVEATEIRFARWQ